MKPSLEAVIAHINEKMKADARIDTEPKLALKKFRLKYPDPD